MTSSAREKICEAHELSGRQRLGASVNWLPHLFQSDACGLQAPGSGSAPASAGATCAGGRSRADDSRVVLGRRRALRGAASNADPTRGRGTNTAGSTVRSIATSQASCTRTLAEPYSSPPGFARSRSAISRWTITTQVSSVGSSAIVRISSGVAIE